MPLTPCALACLLGWGMAAPQVSPGTLRKKSKIGTFANFLDLHLADAIPFLECSPKSSVQFWRQLSIAPY
jgi:hypothetical protein